MRGMRDSKAELSGTGQQCRQSNQRHPAHGARPRAGACSRRCGIAQSHWHRPAALAWRVRVHWKTLPCCSRPDGAAELTSCDQLRQISPLDSANAASVLIVSGTPSFGCGAPYRSSFSSMSRPLGSQGHPASHLQLLLPQAASNASADRLWVTVFCSLTHAACQQALLEQGGCAEHMQQVRQA